MMHRLLIGITLSAFGILVMGIGGCRAVHVTKIDPSSYEAGDTLPGVVYYKPEPYLEITASPKVDKDMNVTGYQTSSRIIYLPNPKSAYAINSGRSGGTNSLDLTLKDGWMLSGIKGTTDPQIDEGIKAIAELVGKVIPAEGIVSSGKIEAKVYILKIKFDEDGNMSLGKAVPAELPI